jgi:vancomycin permeability regulator SanA
MYISKKLWLETFWLETNPRKYLLQDYNERREILARIKAFLEVDIFKVKPTYLWKKIEIISDEKIERVKNNIFK